MKTRAKEQIQESDEPVEVIETTVAHIAEVLEIIEEEAAERKVFANYCDYCGHAEDKSYNAIDCLAICDSCLPDVLEVLNEWEFINACERNRDV